MQCGTPLAVYVDRKIFYGVKTGLNKAFIIDTETRNQLIATDPRSAELIKPVLGGEDIRRWVFRQKDEWLIFTRRGVQLDDYPAISDHLMRWKQDLIPKKNRQDKRGRKPGRYQWFEIQDDVAYFEAFDGPKIVYPDIAKGPRFCLDANGHYLKNTAYCIGSADLYLLGVLNSQLFWFAISNISIPFGLRAGRYRYRLIYQYMEKIPIRRINDSVAADVRRRDRLVSLVENMILLHNRQSAAKTPHERTSLARQIEATDREIDQLVYELYGLTDEDIRIVEEATAR
jgi:hypothetical protein